MIFVTSFIQIDVWAKSPLTESAVCNGQLDEGDVVVRLYPVRNAFDRHMGSAYFTKFGFGFIDISDEESLLQC